MTDATKLRALLTEAHKIADGARLDNVAQAISAAIGWIEDDLADVAYASREHDRQLAMEMRRAAE